MRWCFCRSERVATANHPKVAASAVPVLRHSPVVAAVEVVINQTADAMVIRVKGDAGVNNAGALLAGLMRAAACRPAVVTLDLSELRAISSLAMGVFVSYLRSVFRMGGRVRLAEKFHPAVKAALVRAEIFDLFATTNKKGS
jgi:anti-anti-sigma factor